MNNREAVNWLTNVLADIGKTEHSDLWHYEQALTEIKGMLESAQVSQKGEPMDLIERQAAIRWVKAECNPYGKPTLDFESGKRVMKHLEQMPPAQPEPKWIPCSERLPEEDHWLGGSGKQFSDNVLVSIYNSDDEDEWVDVSQTIDGEWRIELPRHCKVVAWMPLPEPFSIDAKGDE